MKIVAVSYAQSRLKFFRDQLAAANRRLDWSMKHNPDWHDHAEKGEVVSYYELAVKMAEKEVEDKERKEFRCPDCGKMVTTQDIGAECSGGRVWYDFLEPIGYYVPYENRTEENDWYGKDMELTEEQAKQLADFVSENQPYNARDVECMVARVLMRGNKVVINADW